MSEITVSNTISVSAAYGIHITTNASAGTLAAIFNTFNNQAYYETGSYFISISSTGAVINDKDSAIGERLNSGGRNDQQATIVNAGSILATGQQVTGIALGHGGTVVNEAGGVILGAGGEGILNAYNGTLDVFNSGTITGGDPNGQAYRPGAGINLEGTGGYFLNSSSGVISGGNGIQLIAEGVTIVNAGLIEGSATSISGGELRYGILMQYGGDTITNTGTIVGEEGILATTNVLSDTPPALATTIINDGSIISDAVGGPTIAVSIRNGLLFEASTAVISGALAGDGDRTLGLVGTLGPDAGTTIELGAGINLGTLGGLGQYRNFSNLIIDQGGTWDISGKVAGFDIYQDTISVYSSAASTYIYTYINYGMKTTGFDNGDTIDLTDVSFTSGEGVTFTPATSAGGYSILSFDNGNTGGADGGTYSIYINTAPSITNPDFTLVSDGSGGTAIELVGTSAPSLISTITGTVDTGVTLLTYVYQNGVSNRAPTNYASLVTVAEGAQVSGTNAIYAYAYNAGVTLSIVNEGTINGSQQGIYFKDAGLSLVNTGTILGGSEYAVFSSGGGAILNQGSIISETGSGLALLGSQGIITNTSEGVILGAGYGRDGIKWFTTLINQGTVSGSTLSGGVGAFSNAFGGGYLDNQSGGVIAGNAGVEVYKNLVVNAAGGAIYGVKYGVAIEAGATVENSGLITASSGYGIFSSQKAASIYNNVSGEISGAEAGIVLSLGGTVTNQGLITGDTGIYLKNGGTLFDSGTIEASGDAIEGGLDPMLVVLEDGADVQGLVQGEEGGSILELAEGTGTLNGLGANFSTIQFDAGSEFLVAGSTAGLASGDIVTGFAQGDTLELTGFKELGYSYTSAGLVLTRGPNSETIDISGDFTTSSFQVTTDASGDTLITLEGTVPCYLRGTLIRTARGDVPVEALTIGDLVVTAFGPCRAVKWIGERHYDGKFAARNHMLLPILFRAGSVADGVPSRDLYVSPGHAMYVDGVLVPAWRLVNGVSITQERDVAQISYYHVELDEHDVILAEDCPAESFYDEDFRMQFQNAAEYHALYPQAAPQPPLMPRVEDGFVLQAIQARLSARAGAAVPEPVLGALRGFVDAAGPDIVCGWAQDEAATEQPVCLDILADGRRVGRVLANRYRADLRAAGLGGGCHAFAFTLPAGVDGMIEVRRAVDGTALDLTVAADALAA